MILLYSATLPDLCPGLGSSLQERQEHTAENPDKGHEDNDGTRTHLPQRKFERAVTVQLSLLEKRRLKGTLSMQSTQRQGARRIKPLYAHLVTVQSSLRL